MSRVPKTIKDFIQRQATIPIAELWKQDPKEYRSPYASYWYKAIACILLSGRVAPKWGGHPNKTEVNRVCKEANFNPYLADQIARFLVDAEVIKANRSGEYEKGPAFAAFWQHDPQTLRRVVQNAVLKIVQGHSGSCTRRSSMVWQAGLIEFLTLFFGCFKGLALQEQQIGKVLHEFSTLPEGDLVRVAESLGIKAKDFRLDDWRYWLEIEGQKALLAALYAAEWAYWEERDRQQWFFPSPMALGMLGLATMPPVSQLPTDLKVLPNNSIYAGAGREMDLLVCLSRYCRIKRIDQVFEFQLEPRRLAQTPAKTSPGEELLAVLKDLEPLPDTVAALLGTKSKLGGVIGIRWCSALVKPQEPETLTAIREHPRLKGYLEAGAPPGYLLIKSTSNPETFAQRCQVLGFEVRSL
jgi:hypothetical protein